MSAENIDSPLVSVIIPTYNRAHVLSRAIRSVQKQTYRGIEIIIVDDGSTDETQTVVAEIAKEIKQITYVKKDNGGCASARNRGLALAKGDFLAFLDSDDEWLSITVEALVHKLQESGAELVYSPSIEVGQDGIERLNYPVAAGKPEMLAQKHFMSTRVRNGSYMFTRSAFKKVGGLDESLKYNEDSDYVQRLSIHCRAAYLPSPTIRVYNHENSKSRNRIEIYKALLKSSEKTLMENPGFTNQLGADVNKRIRQIKAKLVEALVLEDNLSEANSIAKDIFGSLRLNVKLALLSGSNAALKREYLVRGYLSEMKKHLLKFHVR